MKKSASLLPEMMQHLTHRPVTRLYPFEKVTPPEGFRGTPRFKPNNCIGCKACVRDCTAEAIEIDVRKIDPPPGSPKGPNRRRKMVCTIYLDRCVHCARCVEVCPKDALYMDAEFEVANFTRDALKIVQESD